MLCKNICDTEWMISKLPEFGFLSDYVNYVLSASFVGMDEDFCKIKHLKYICCQHFSVCVCVCVLDSFIQGL